MQIASGKNQGEAHSENKSETDESTNVDVHFSNFKSNKLSQINRKKRVEDLKVILKSGKDVIDTKDVLRLPNILKTTMKLTTDPNGPT